MVLKCSLHLMALPALLRAFPDACVVYTVRPVSQVLPSYCSNLQHLHNYGTCGEVQVKTTVLFCEISAR